ncbi:hypothetical protein [Burkholderia sp. WAC0059]|uniref:hypothetical protein n=1 Tax=Burkholderia sp. WAC0059 TaxID=2066022 RepID=UPI0011AEC5B2|nr:hypothetical protein [Burkholderia sp. WAC0059]
MTKKLPHDLPVVSHEVGMLAISTLYIPEWRRSMASVVRKHEGRELLVRVFSVGDQRPLDHFLSDSAIALREVVVAGKLNSSKDFEGCLIYEIDQEKITANKFRRIVVGSTHAK